MSDDFLENLIFFCLFCLFYLAIPSLDDLRLKRNGMMHGAGGVMHLL